MYKKHFSHGFDILNTPDAPSRTTNMLAPFRDLLACIMACTSACMESNCLNLGCKCFTDLSLKFLPFDSMIPFLNITAPILLR